LLRSLDETSPDFQTAKSKLISASRSIADLFQRVQQTTKRGDFSVYYTHATTLCALNIVQYLTEPGITDIFHTMVVVLSCVARRWTLARGILRMLWITVSQRQLEGVLDVSTLGLFELNTVENWGSHERRILEACAYPNYSALGEKSRYLVEMGDLLQEYAAMQLDTERGHGRGGEGLAAQQESGGGSLSSEVNDGQNR
jgi:hypothetical protein